MLQILFPEDTRKSMESVLVLQKRAVRLFPLEILQLKSIKDMAVELDITERTVKYRISRIFEKTGTKNQRELLKKINE